MTEYVQANTTTDSRGKAEEIARTLVEARLAGCVQILGPMASIYWWKGKVESTQEWLCFIKTRRDLFPEVEKTIKRLHNYTVPEILATPITAGSADYLEWLRQETLSGGSEA